MPTLSVVRGSGMNSHQNSESLSVSKLRAFLEDERMRRRGPNETFEAFEKRLHAQLQEVEREVQGSLQYLYYRSYSAEVDHGVCLPGLEP